MQSRDDMKNLILIGMPAVGKSTLGVLLAKAMCCGFCDTDLLIQKNCGTSLCDYIERHGATEFIKFEEQILCSLNVKNTVVATGGSAVYGKDAMAHLKTNGVIIYLRASADELKKRIGDIKTRGVVLLHGSTVEDILEERLPLYEKYADITIDCDRSAPEENLEKIISAVNLYLS